MDISAKSCDWVDDELWPERSADQVKRLLRLVTERRLNGQPELLKEYNIGLEAFQRPPDYDPKVDPVVGVQARRL